VTTPPLLDARPWLYIAGQLPTCGLAPCALRGLGQALASRVRVRVIAVAGVVPLIGTGSAPGRLGGRRKRQLSGTRGRGGASPGAAYRARVTGRHLRPGPLAPSPAAALVQAH
jgi:hypothetical protein